MSSGKKTADFLSFYLKVTTRVTNLASNWLDILYPYLYRQINGLTPDVKTEETEPAVKNSRAAVFG